MRKVARHTQPRRSFYFIYIFILIFLTSCRLSERPEGQVLTSYNMPPEAWEEIDMLNRNYYLSNTTRQHIYSLMIKQCLLAENQGIPCVYPQINYPPNDRAIK